MPRSRHLYPLCVIAFCLFQSVAAQAAPGALDFTVLRDGEEVGSHSLRFGQDGDSLRVTIDTKVVVKMAMIPVYRFEHHGVERWINGRLSTLNSKTNDDGTRHELAVSTVAGGLDVTGDGVTRRDGADDVPASLWNEQTVKQTTLLNTLDGRFMQVKVTDQGTETVKTESRMLRAHHYVMSGDLARELWYDETGNLVQVKFKAKDGSDILYRLK